MTADVPKPSSSPFLLLSMSYGVKYLWLVWVICLVVALPPGCTAQSIHCEVAEGETETALMLCRHCSARPKILVCYQHCIGHKSKPQHPVSCYDEN